MILEQPSKYLRWLYPHALWRMDTSQRSVYLTFDDGPIPEATPFILDTLRQYDIKATFFVVGDNVRKYPELFLQIVSEGHRIGNHTFNHLGGARHMLHTYINNVRMCQNIIDANMTSSGDGLKTSRSFSEKQRLLFRPPHGWMRHDQYAWLSRRYKIVMWDLVTRDYSRRLTADDVVSNVKHYARNGSIITFHDSLRSIDKLHTALPQSLEWLIQQGYNFQLL